VEHPGHRPAMVAGEGSFGGVGRKRWDVWAEATREAWQCQVGTDG